MSSLFQETVAVVPAGEGRYRARVEPAWDGPVSPNGGILAATMLEAARAELGASGPVARTVSAHFLQAPRSGEVELAVSVLRRGKRVLACEVRMLQAEALMVQATVLFSAARGDLLALRRPPPDMPPPDPGLVLETGALAGAPPIFRALALQPTVGSIPLSRAPEARCGGWTWMRGDEGPVDAARLVALSDAWFPAIFPVLEEFAGVPTLQLTVQLRHTTPVAWPVLCRFRTRHLHEGHLEETGEIFSADGELLAESTQLALLLAPSGATGDQRAPSSTSTSS